MGQRDFKNQSATYMQKPHYYKYVILARNLINSFMFLNAAHQN